MCVVAVEGRHPFLAYARARADPRFLPVPRLPSADTRDLPRATPARSHARGAPGFLGPPQGRVRRADSARGQPENPGRVPARDRGAAKFFRGQIFVMPRQVLPPTEEEETD